MRFCVQSVYFGNLSPAWGRFSEPGPRLGRWRAGALWEARRGYQTGKGRGGGKRAGLSTDGGRVLPHIPSVSSWTLGWGAGKQGGWFSGIRAGNYLEPVPGFSKFQVFIQLVLNGTCGILRIDRTIRIHVRRCARCLARRKRAAGRAADAVRYGRRCCSRAIPGACHQF